MCTKAGGEHISLILVVKMSVILMAIWLSHSPFPHLLLIQGSPTHSKEEGKGDERRSVGGGDQDVGSEWDIKQIIIIIIIFKECLSRKDV